jgi:hypothetical protein
MDALITQVQDTFEGQIVGICVPSGEKSPTDHEMRQDFEGQRASELVCTVLLSMSAVSAAYTTL